jgi:Tfp pilus assembly protein PilZ
MDETKKSDLRQREFLRVPTSIPISVICLTKDGTIPEGTWVKGEMPQIGGGGARIETPVDMTVGDVVCLKFRFPDTEDEMKLYARVVGVPDRTESGAACVKFVGMSESERGRVLRFLFKEQIRNAKEMVEQGTSSGGEKSEHQGPN